MEQIAKMKAEQLKHQYKQIRQKQQIEKLKRQCMHDLMKLYNELMKQGNLTTAYKVKVFTRDFFNANLEQHDKRNP